MFQMTVEHSVKLHDNLISVIGPCVNKKQFTAGQLSDGQGRTYEAHIPFDKTLVSVDTRVILGIFGNMDAEELLGKTLVAM
jgi:hypothetical protein